MRLTDVRLTDVRLTNGRLTNGRLTVVLVPLQLTYQWIWPPVRTTFAMYHPSSLLIHSDFLLDFCLSSCSCCKGNPFQLFVIFNFKNGFLSSVTHTERDLLFLRDTTTAKKLRDQLENLSRKTLAFNSQRFCPEILLQKLQTGTIKVSGKCCWNQSVVKSQRLYKQLLYHIQFT